MNRVRRSFAFRLLLAGVLMTAMLVLVVAGVLLAGRERQAVSTGVSTAANRAQTVRELLQQVTLPEERSIAELVSRRLEARGALGDPAQEAAVVRAVLAAEDQPVTIVVLDAAGHVVGSTRGAPTTTDVGDPSAVASALRGQTVQGVLPRADGTADSAVVTPVLDAGSVVGAVAAVTPLSDEISRFGAAVGYATSYVAPGARTDPSLTDGVARGADQVTGTTSTDDAVALAALRTPTDGPAGYVGVTVPLGQFLGDAHGEELTLVLLAVTAMTVMALLTLVFVDRFVRRPVHSLERGVARIAGGDLSTDVPVGRKDELGMLAASVNRMRRQLAGHIGQLEVVLAHLGMVSRTLTTTGAGAERLAEAVAHTAAAITGGRAAVVRRDATGALRVDAPMGDLSPTAASRLAGAVHEPAPLPLPDGSHLLALPMRTEAEDLGVLAVTLPDGRVLSDVDERALHALADNAAVALAHARLFAQEQETVRRLRGLEAARAEFLATARHELRTPITIVTGLVEIAEDSWARLDDDHRVSIIGDIGLATRQLASTLETMIEFTLASGDGLRLNRESVPLGEAVTTALDSVRGRRGAAEAPGIVVDIPLSLHVDADERRLQMVLAAVLDNALKFTPPSGHVEVRAHRDDGAVILQVADDGCGIPPDALPHVFERFFQADGSTTRAHGGMGMGLALAECLCRAHGATIGVSSVEGAGTTVTVRWPGAPSATDVAVLTGAGTLSRV